MPASTGPRHHHAGDARQAPPRVERRPQQGAHGKREWVPLRRPGSTKPDDAAQSEEAFFRQTTQSPSRPADTHTPVPISQFSPPASAARRVRPRPPRPAMVSPSAPPLPSRVSLSFVCLFDGCMDGKHRRGDGTRLFGLVRRACVSIPRCSSASSRRSARFGLVPSTETPNRRILFLIRSTAPGVDIVVHMWSLGSVWHIIFVSLGRRSEDSSEGIWSPFLKGIHLLQTKKGSLAASTFFYSLFLFILLTWF